jgi:hypothetical protein
MSDINKVWAENRLLVVGSNSEVQLFRTSNWNRRLRGRFGELIENTRGRFNWAFVTEAPPIESLTRLSKRWPQLVLILDYEVQRERLKGLAKAKAGKLQHYHINY